MNSEFLQDVLAGLRLRKKSYHRSTFMMRRALSTLTRFVNSMSTIPIALNFGCYLRSAKSCTPISVKSP